MFQKFSPQHGWSSKPTCCNLSVRFAKSMIMLFMMVMVMVVQPVPGCITPLQCIWRISLSTSRYQRSSHGLLSILIPIISIDPFTNNLQQISIICISQTYVYNTYIHAEKTIRSYWCQYRTKHWTYISRRKLHIHRKQIFENLVVANQLQPTLDL